jgi:cytosine deaminase
MLHSADMLTETQLRIGTEAAYFQALKSYREGGVPVGAALLLGDTVAAVGHNRRVQDHSNILHGETDCFERAGHHLDFAHTVMFTTLSPCQMCAGAILLFRVPTVVVLDDVNVLDFDPGADRLREHGVEVIIHPHEPSIELNRDFQKNHRTIWMGDIGH